MSCGKCGCRMLTKVGHRQPMLICTDCGHPRSEVEAGERQQQLVSGSVLLLGLSVLASMTFWLVNMRQTALEAPQAAQQQLEGQASSEAE